MTTLYLLAAFGHLTAVGWMPAQGQSIDAGTWTGFVTPPGGSPYTSTYNFRYRGDSLVVRMTVEDWAAEFPLHNVRIEDDAIRFWWQPITRVDCELVLKDTGVNRGECWDADGRTAPMIMAPPGVDVDSELRRMRDAAEAARREHAKWQRRRELDGVEGQLGKMVDVGGFELNALVDGEGPASVVLISDIGDDLRTWDYVVHDAKDFARVVSYSRAGIGYSESGSKPTTIEQTAGDLRELLDEAGVDPPYVVVGHAIGAAFAQGLPSCYPDVVAGMVLVDPSHPGLGRRLQNIDPQSWETYWNRQKSLYEIVPEPVRAEFELYREMVENGTVSGTRAVPQVPVAVISSLRAPETPRWVGETPEGLQAKKQLHVQLAASFDDGVHLTAHDSGRYIQRENPDLVIRAIRQVLDRSESGSLC